MQPEGVKNARPEDPALATARRLAALEEYERLLASGLAHEQDAGRPTGQYEHHLRAARELGDMLAGGARDEELRAWARREERAHGWGFLPDHQGDAATKSFFVVASTL